MQPFETIDTTDNHRVSIYFDEHCESPREWENQTTLLCFHNNYVLGDKNPYNAANFNDWADFEETLFAEDYDVVVPLYLYDHSGISISTKPFSCGFDSGQVGFAVMKLEEDCSVEYALELIENEVEYYDEYLRGNVFGFIKTDIITGKEVDSCWGFIGSSHEESGLFDHAGIAEEDIRERKACI